MTNTQKKPAKLEAVNLSGKSVDQLVELAANQPELVPAIKAHAAKRLAVFTERGCFAKKLAAWTSIVDGSMTGWPKPEPKAVAKKKPAKKAAKSAKADDNAEIKALLAEVLKRL